MRPLLAIVVAAATGCIDEGAPTIPPDAREFPPGFDAVVDAEAGPCVYAPAATTVALIGCEVVLGTTASFHPVSAHVVDYETAGLVPRAEVAFFNNGDLGQPLGVVIADDSAAYSYNFPPGVTKLVTRTGHSSAITTYDWFADWDADARSYSLATLASLPLSVPSGKGVILVQVQDCMFYPAGHVIVTLSRAIHPCASIAGVETLYFDATGTPALGLQETTSNGRVMFVGVPPEEDVVLQLWGATDVSEVVARTSHLIGKATRQAYADSVVLTRIVTTGADTPGP